MICPGRRARHVPADHERVTPVLDGCCAMQPEAWTVHEDRLYLNANLRARELWLKDVPGNFAKGLANWPGILEG